MSKSQDLYQETSDERTDAVDERRGGWVKMHKVKVWQDEVRVYPKIMGLLQVYLTVKPSPTQ